MFLEDEAYRGKQETNGKALVDLNFILGANGI